MRSPCSSKLEGHRQKGPAGQEHSGSLPHHEEVWRSDRADPEGRGSRLQVGGKRKPSVEGTMVGSQEAREPDR